MDRKKYKHLIANKLAVVNSVVEDISDSVSEKSLLLNETKILTSLFLFESILNFDDFQFFRKSNFFEDVFLEVNEIIELEKDINLFDEKKVQIEGEMKEYSFDRNYFLKAIYFLLLYLIERGEFEVVVYFSAHEDNKLELLLTKGTFEERFFKKNSVENLGMMHLVELNFYVAVLILRQMFDRVDFNNSSIVIYL